MDKEETATRLITKLDERDESCAHLVGYLYSIDECKRVLNRYIRTKYTGVRFIWNHIFNLLSESEEHALLLVYMNKWWKSVWKVENMKREKGACIDGCFTPTKNPVVSGFGSSSGTVRRNASDMYAIFSCCDEEDCTANYSSMQIYTEIVRLTQVSFGLDLIKGLPSWFDLPGNYLLPICVCRLLRKDSDVTKSGIFWALSSMMKALLDAVPDAPEFAFIEVADIVDQMLPSIDGKKRDSLHLQAVHLHAKALSAYPFSRMMWQSYEKCTSKFASTTKL
ncbi:hypothetical protein ACH5RR_019103 [Cinchona calisaya]|uniref:Uncharacterized protein n=1 Tax=Cinchona calisaya TaxID=153742 RepID=A0ABD2ZPB0_9GENT